MLLLLLLLFGCRPCVRRVLIWALAVYCYCLLRVCLAPLGNPVLRVQVMRLKPVVLVRAVISTWPCCFCFGSGRGGVMLLLLVTDRAAQFVLLA